MKKGILLMILAIALTFGLSSCGLRAPEELYALPDPSPEYESLQENLETLLNNGYEYAAPVSGDHTQSVQMEDLDGDGTDEALAFMRDSSGQNHPLKIYIFKADGEGGYTQACIIEGDGDMFNSVVYCQLNDTSTEEIVVGWRISSTVYALSAFSIENSNVTELMTAASYTRYAVEDMDQDNLEEIISIDMSATEEGAGTATYYDWTEDSKITAVNTVSLSASADSLESVRYHYLVDSYPALYVTSYLKENGTSKESSSSVVTDVLSVSGYRLINLSMDSATGDSRTDRLNLTDPQDINNDNVLELPMTRALHSNSQLEHSDGCYVIEWVQYAIDGNETSVGFTYHNTTDGWFFKLPENWFNGWDGEFLNGLLLSRSDTNVGATVESSVMFYHQDNLEDQPKLFLIIQKNTGTNRDSRSESGERFLLFQTGDAAYSAEFVESDWSCGLNSRTLTERFKLIYNNWSVD